MSENPRKRDGYDVFQVCILIIITSTLIIIAAYVGRIMLDLSSAVSTSKDRHYLERLNTCEKHPHLRVCKSWRLPERDY